MKISNVAAIVLALPLVYVGSIGPAYWASYEIGNAGQELYSSVYRPVWWMAERWGAAGRVLDRYLEFWALRKESG